MQDVTPQNERSIRRIPVPAGHRRTHEQQEDERPHRRSRRRGRFMLLALGAVAVFGVLGLLLAVLFAGATVKAHPRTQVVVVPPTLEAQRNAPVGTLSFEVLSLSRSATTTAPMGGTELVSRQASGVITVSNSYSTASQRLIANTRFEAPDGKIYRIRDSVTVPGMSGGKAGTATATVYADSPGPSYNRPLATTFTIPGFKGDPRYSKFSAESQGALSGGFIGDEPAVAPADLAAAKAALQKQVDADVRAAAATQIPQDSVAIPGTLSVVFADMVQASGPDKTATLTQSATATGAIVRAADLAAAIARRGVTGYKGEAVLFGDTSKMSLTAATSSKLSDGTLTLQLGGSATLLWQYD